MMAHAQMPYTIDWKGRPTEVRARVKFLIWPKCEHALITSGLPGSLQEFEGRTT